jgi:hypothetical protein
VRRLGSKLCRRRRSRAGVRARAFGELGFFACFVMQKVREALATLGTPHANSIARTGPKLETQLEVCHAGAAIDDQQSAHRAAVAQQLLLVAEACTTQTHPNA